MNRPLLGLLVGALVGLLDGATAKFTSPDPVYQEALLSIALGSSFKGLLGGLVTGWVARRSGSLAFGMLVGLGVAVALATVIAVMNANYYDDPSLYWKIIAPGAVTGLIVGYTVIQYGRRSGGKKESATVSS